MSSFMQNPTSVTRKWHIIDAQGKPLGRVAVVAASILRGKHKPTFTPNVDCGDHCIIINCDKVILTGNKMEQKTYYSHTGYIGGIKAKKVKLLLETKPELVMEKAVKGMIPNTSLGRSAMSRLRTFKGQNHVHAAQQPEMWSGEIR